MKRNNSPWLDLPHGKEYPQLDGAHETEVLVVGAGLAGVLTAYLLTKAGKQVTLIEADRIGPSAATGWTTAFLTSIIDTSLADLSTFFGRPQAKGVYQAHLDAIALVRSIAAKETIDCDFADCMAYSYTNRSSDIKHLESEHELLKSFGFPARLVTDNDLPIPALAYLEVSNQAKFHPIKFIRQLTKHAADEGLTVYEKTQAEAIEGEDVLTVRTNHGTITASDVIVTTYSPFNNPAALRAKKGAYTSYVLEAEIPKGTIPESLYSDLENPYHYFRIDPIDSQHDRMILGGEDHRQELSFLKAKSYRLLEQYAQELLTGIDYTISREWDGQILESVDGLAFIGQVAPHQFAATGFGGNGMTYSAIAAEISCDLLTGKENPAIELFAAQRSPTLKQLTNKGGHYIQEFWNGAFLKLFR